MWRRSATWLFTAAFLLSAVADLPAQETTPKLALKITSVYPLAAAKGTVSEIEIQGENLDGVSAVWFGSQGIQGQVKKVEPIKLLKITPDSQLLVEREEVSGHRVVVELGIDSPAKVGRHSLRLVSPRGLSSAHPFVVTGSQVVREGETAHSTPESPQELKIPVLVSGKIWGKGEVDYYSFDALAGQEIEFQAVSNVVATRGNVDAVQLTLYEPTGSWFDPKRPTRLAFSEYARLRYKFSKGGRYLLLVGTFAGISGPDMVYVLRIAPAGSSTASNQPAGLPELHESRIDALRQPFVRKLERNRVEALLGRSVAAPQPEKDTPKSAPSAAEGELDLSQPVLLEGSIDRPRKVDSYKLRAKAGQRLAFELETPEASLPQFTPRLELVDANGQDVCSNIWRRVGGDNNHLMKTLQAKTIYTFERDGEYTVRIRNLVSRQADPSFQYRLLIRPQVPHVGKIKVEQDSINVVPGKAGKLTVTVEQEEGYSGEVALSLEGLPPGLRAFTGAETPPARGGLLDEGRKEQYVPKTQKVVILVLGSSDAAATAMPQMVRLVARPVVEGRVGAPLLVQEIPVSVSKPDATDATELARKGT